MGSFAEVRHDLWIAAPLERVRAQFADLDHHIRAHVHRRLRLEPLLRRADGSLRYAQETRLLGLRQRDVFERTFGDDGSMIDVSVEGHNRGGSLHFAFRDEGRQGLIGTRVHIIVRLPLPRLLGPLLRPLLQAQLRREVCAAADEDRFDLEVRGYPAAAGAPALDTVLPA